MNAEEVIWQPIPNTSQELAIDTRAQVTLYCGNRGPGKTDTQLMLFRRYVGIGYGKFWRGVIFDREYKNLDDLVSKAKRWFPLFEDGGKFKESKADYKYVWPTGEELLFRAIKKKEDYWNYHGQEFPFIGWNELTKYPTPDLFDMLDSCNRSSFTPEKDNPDISEIPLITFATSNPFGPGHNWVKKRFIDVAPYGVLLRNKIKAFDPKTKEDIEINKTQVSIFGSYKENIYLSPQYVAKLESIKDENLREAWLKGSWNIIAGGALGDLWDKGVHEIPRFAVPVDWRVDRSFDWGSTHPFSVGWWAEADGTEVVMPNGKIFCPPRGSLIQIAEWYGSNEIGENKGLKMSATDIAKGIKEREIKLMEDGWICQQPWPGPADNQIGNVNNSEEETIETKMAKLGIRWTKSDKSPGSRKIGLQNLRDRLEAALRGAEDPGIWFMQNCLASIATLPILPRDPDNLDDIDTDCEDHAYDMVKYRCLKSSNRMAKNINFAFPS